MLGTDLKAWRASHDYTQEKLRLELGVTRQTIVAWEQSRKPLARLVELALLALEHLPKESVKMTGKQAPSAVQQFERKRGRRLEAS
jgi:DNA-binding XRE family transcriptional regulator